MVALVLLGLAALVVGLAWPSGADIRDASASAGLGDDLFSAVRLWLGTLILLVLGIGLIVVLLVERGWVRDFGRIVNSALREITRPLFKLGGDLVAPLVGLIKAVL